MELQEIQKSYERKQKLYNTKNKTFDTQIENAEQTLKALQDAKSKLTYPHYHENYLKPIALELLKVFNNRTYEIFGPFGLNCESSIHLYKKGVKESEKFEGKNCISVTFRLRHHGLYESYLVLVNHLKNSGRYCKGSIGEMNGDNYEEVEMKSTMDELVKFIKIQNRVSRKKK